VERDPHVRELQRHFLSEAGDHVAFAEDGLQALELVRTLRPAVVITEILIPKLDGLALCQRVKSDAPLKNTVVVVLSLLAARTRAQAAGADAFLSKPLLAQKLTETVRTLVNSRPPAAEGGFPLPASKPAP
jgi:two-component system response regulator MprA